VSQMFTCGLSDLLSCGRFVGCFVLGEYLSGLNINIARSEILVSCLVYIDQLLFLSKLLIFSLAKLTVKSYIKLDLIKYAIVYSVMLITHSQCIYLTSHYCLNS
jgi:hypothetical protein